MSTTQEAVATAPQINGKDVAVHTVKQVGTAAFIGITAVASLVKYGTAHAVHLIDKTQNVINTAEEIDTRAKITLEKYHNVLSGFKPEIIK